VAVRNLIRTEHVVPSRLAAKGRKQLARRQRVASRFQERIFRRALAKAGIDYREIQKRQAKDDAANGQLVKQQKRALIAHSKAVALRQAAILEWLYRREHIVPVPEPLPPRQIRLDTAIIVAYPIVAGTDPQFTTSSGPGRNLLRGLIEAQSDRGQRFVTLVAEFHFQWTSDRDGMLSVSSAIWPNLTTWLMLGAGCTGDPWVDAKVQASLLISQIDKTGQARTAGAPEIVLVSNALRGSNSVGQVGGQDFSDVVPLSYQNFPVVEANPVLITVFLGLTAEVINGPGQAQIDIESGEYRINVPWVDLLVS